MTQPNKLAINDDVREIKFNNGEAQWFGFVRISTIFATHGDFLWNQNPAKTASASNMEHMHNANEIEI